jgi:hypothetical protein
MFHDPDARGRNWHKELPLVVWALRTNINRETKDTPFNLVYGANTVLPPEIYLESAQVAHFNEENQIEARELDSNLLEEKCSTALANVWKYHESRKRYYNKSIVLRELDIRNLVQEGYLHQRQAQIFIALRRTVHHSGHSSTRGLHASRSRRWHTPQYVEC